MFWLLGEIPVDWNVESLLRRRRTTSGTPLSCALLLTLQVVVANCRALTTTCLRLDPSQARLNSAFRELISPGSDVLDLMSSWASHFDGLSLNKVRRLPRNSTALAHRGGSHGFLLIFL